METKQPSRGRQRVPMAMISDLAARHVCFTKRRRGLFKKVCELSTLCGNEALALVTSTAGKLFSIGTPDVPTAVHRFLHLHSQHNAAAEQQQPQEDVPASTDVHHRQLLGQLHKEVDGLETSSEELRDMRALLLRSVEEKARRLPHGWGEKLRDLPTGELEEMMVELEKLLATVGVDTTEMVGEEGTVEWNHLRMGALVVDHAVRPPIPVPLPPPHPHPLMISSGLLDPRNLFTSPSLTGFMPSPPFAANTMRPSSSVASAALMAPMMNPSGFKRPAASLLLPPMYNSVVDTISSVGSVGSSTSLLEPRNGEAHKYFGGLNPPVTNLTLPTHEPMKMAGFTNVGTATMTSSVTRVNDGDLMKSPSVFGSSAPLPLPAQRKNTFGSMASTSTADRSRSPTRVQPSCLGRSLAKQSGRTPALALFPRNPPGLVRPCGAAPPPPRVAKNSSAEGNGGRSCEARAGASARGDAIYGAAGRTSKEFFDIPRDFDFARDWSI